MFQLHPDFQANTHLLTELELCQVRAMNDGQNPWVILIPTIPDLTEIHHLSPDDRISLIEEIALVTEKLETEFKPDKINVGALGNLTPQLHIHVIARYATDRAWPGPIWGSEDPEPEQAKIKLAQLEKLFP